MIRKQQTVNVVNFADYLKNLPTPSARLQKEFKQERKAEEIENKSLMAAASVAYQQGHISIGDKLIRLYRAAGFPQWVLLPRDLIDYCLSVDVTKAIP